MKQQLTRSAQSRVTGLSHNTMTSDIYSVNSVPVPNENFKIDEIDGEILLYSLSETKTIYLNETATVIWQLCDGVRSADEIVSYLQLTYPDARDTIGDDVETALAQFIEEGAIQLKQIDA